MYLSRDTNVTGKSAEDLTSRVGVKKENGALNHFIEHFLMIALGSFNQSQTQKFVFDNVNQNIISNKASKES